MLKTNKICYIFKTEAMNTTQQDVITEILQKLDAYKQLPNPQPLFSIGKDIITSCPADTDMRAYFDPLIESIIIK